MLISLIHYFEIDLNFIFVVFQCGVCDEAFEQAKELKQHVTVAHVREERNLPLKYQPLSFNPAVKNRFECFMCKMRLNRITDVKNHIKQHAHYNRKCEVCAKRFTSNQEHQLHMCDTMELSINCEYCSGSFVSISQLLAHLECEHDNRIMYRCQKCPKFFGMQQLVDLHEKCHPEGVEKPFACEQCSWRFGNQEKLDRHLRVHSNESM